MKQIDFSVIIATRNRENYLKEAINSILEQKSVSTEIIIIDDASTDNTFNIIKDMSKYATNIQYIRNKECCFAHESRKKGYQKANGKYIVFMDDDDFYIDNEFFKKAQDILCDDNIGSVIASTITYENNELKETLNFNAEGLIDNKEYLNYFMDRYKKPMSTLSAVFRKKTLDFYRLNTSDMVNDTCIFLYGIMEGNVYLINKPVAAYRIHLNNISKKKFEYQFVKKCLDEKIKLYNIAKPNLHNRKKWLYIQLSASTFYFLLNSKKDILFIVRIMFWILVHGKGTQILFLKSTIKHFD